MILLVILSFQNGVADQHVGFRYGMWRYSEEEYQGPLPDDIDVKNWIV